MKQQNLLPIKPSPCKYPDAALPARAGLSLFVSLFLAAVMLIVPVASSAAVSVGISVTIGPPPLPVYVQPLCPGPGFIWIPGYWAWDQAFGYYWVPGVWVPAPFIGALWTPGYWAWSNGVYIWNEGYWGSVVGFYGGINYGFGYTGFGYHGGYWSGGAYYYNRTVNNISVTNITTIYSKPVGGVQPSRVSYNGGQGGIIARPTSEQLAAARQQHSSLTSEQRHQMQVARFDPRQRVSANRGRPVVAATVKPGAFSGHGVVRASRAGAPYRSPAHGKAEPREHIQPSKPAPMHAPVARSERTGPGHSPGEPEHRGSRNWQESEPDYYRPRPQHEQPQAPQPRSQKENNMSEGREFR